MLHPQVALDTPINGPFVMPLAARAKSCGRQGSGRRRKGSTLREAHSGIGAQLLNGCVGEAPIGYREQVRDFHGRGPMLDQPPVGYPLPQAHPRSQGS